MREISTAMYNRAKTNELRLINSEVGYYVLIFKKLVNCLKVGSKSKMAAISNWALK